VRSVFVLLFLGVFGGGFLSPAPARAREGRVAILRHVPRTAPPSVLVARTLPRARRAAATQTTGASSLLPAVGQILNCGNDGTIDAAGTLALDPLAAAGTIFPALAGVDSLDILSISFGVVDFGAVYPAILAVDIWQETSPASRYEFVAGVDVAIDTDPTPNGENYQVDLSPYGIRTNNHVLVLLVDPAPTSGGYVLPAGDGSPQCYEGCCSCSVVESPLDGKLYLYGISDAQACPAPTWDHSLLFDVVVELTVQDASTPTRQWSFGTVKAGYAQ